MISITMLCLTKERPAGAVTAVQSLHATASGEHLIKYIIGVDADDIHTGQTLRQMSWKGGVQPRLMEFNQAKTLGDRWNAMASSAMCFGEKPNVLGLIADDMVCITQNWDIGAAGILAKGYGCFHWTEAKDPNNCTYPFVSEPWYNANGRLFSGWFPFWFDDTWLQQVYAFVHGTEPPRITDMILGGLRGYTRGMRDLRFWVEFFGATLILRVQEAEDIRNKLGLPPLHVERTRQLWQKFSQIDSMYNVEAIEQVRGDKHGPVPFGYAEAKKKAEDWLLENQQLVLATACAMGVPNVTA
jgi:hypothetical protein